MSYGYWVAVVLGVMTDTLQTKLYDNPGRLHVWGIMRLDYVDWQVSAWCHRWSDGLWHVGIEQDSDLLRTNRFCAVKVHWTKLSWQSSLAVRRRLIRNLEKQLNRKGEKPMPKKKVETRTVAQQLADEKNAKKSESKPEAMMARMAIPTIDSPTPITIQPVPKEVKSLPALPNEPVTEKPKGEKKVRAKAPKVKVIETSADTPICLTKCGPGFNRLCGKPAEKGSKYCSRHELKTRIERARSHKASRENILNALLKSEAGYGQAALPGDQIQALVDAAFGSNQAG
jgi:hypothetical protein